jgi:hypothetical protein
MTEAWAPALEDVGQRIPTRTRNARSPGDDALLGTFTADTTPNADQAQAVIDNAVNGVLALCGPMPAAADPAGPVVRQQARDAAAWQAAADIEIAYPNRDADVHVAQQLQARANAAVATLVKSLGTSGEGEVAQYPVWSAPDPPPWADRDPGDFTPLRGVGPPGYWTGGP